MDGCRRSRTSHRHATPHHATPRHDTMRWAGEGGSCYAAKSLGEGADSPASGRGTRSAVVAQPGHPCSLRRGGWAPCRHRVTWHGAPHRAAAAHQQVARWSRVAPPWHAAATTRRKAGSQRKLLLPVSAPPPRVVGRTASLAPTMMRLRQKSTRRHPPPAHVADNTPGLRKKKSTKPAGHRTSAHGTPGATGEEPRRRLEGRLCGQAHHRHPLGRMQRAQGLVNMSSEGVGCPSPSPKACGGVAFQRRRQRRGGAIVGHHCVHLHARGGSGSGG